jgi:hypothetical protein
LKVKFEVSLKVNLEANPGVSLKVELRANYVESENYYKLCVVRRLLQIMCSPNI